MPYIIGLIVIVLIGVGFTLLQSNPKTETAIQNAPETVLVDDTTGEIGELNNPNPPEEQSAETAPLPESNQGPLPSAPTTSNSPPTNANALPAAAPATRPPTPAQKFADGTYNAQTNYRTPGGAYKITVSLTVKDDVVTNSNVSYDASTAKDVHSQAFSAAYKSQVVSKNLEAINLSRVGGSSLTTGAFNKALTEIKAQAAT
jgi:hypothetical protein